MNHTTGDQYRAECPACGEHIIALWELGDGLRPGEKFNCGHCGSEVTIEDVETSVTVTLTAESLPRRTADTPCPTPGCGHVFPAVGRLYGLTAFAKCPMCGAFTELRPDKGGAAQGKQPERGGGR